MKTRSTPVDPPNIAAGVKARRTARIGSPLYRSQSDSQPEEGSNSLPATSVNTIDKIDEHISKSRQVSQKASIKDIWTAYDRKLFFQGVRLYGRNFNELARFMRSRGHRTDTATNTTSNQLPVSSEVPSTNPQPNSPNVVAPVAAAAGLLPSNSTNQSGAQSAGVEGRTKDQVRLFYQQTWHKLRRYIKYPDGVPQHVREVYAIINWSIMRCRIKKALDNRLGEKLNELVHYGSTCVKHNGRRFLLRTPVCPALKQLNHISAPTQEFTLPDDVWVELVPATQMVAWRVLEAEQNPRLRLRVDINRQLSDVISLVEAKWVFPTDRIRSLLCPVDPTAAAAAADNTQTSEKLLLRFVREQRLDGAISLQEVSRTRSTDIALNAYLARRQSSQSPSKTVSPADANVGNTTPDVVAGEGTAAPASRTSTHEDQRPAVPPRTGGAATAAAASTVTSGVVHLDLHTVGKQLATGVTFEEARAIKLIVIFLALGCPARIRFEYDFVQSGHGKASSYIALSKEAMANGEGISNGLRRLLHLSASEYLNLKNWNQPNRPSASVRGHARKSTSTHPPAAAIPASRGEVLTFSPVAVPSGGQAPGVQCAPHPLPPQQQPPPPPPPQPSVTLASQPTEFAPPPPPPPAAAAASAVTPANAGHEVLLVGKRQNQNATMVVARKLNVQRPPPSTAPKPTHQRPLLPLPTPKVPIPPLHSSVPALPISRASYPSPATSLHALRAFSQNQARRVSRRRSSLAVTRKRKSPMVPQNPPPPSSLTPQPFSNDTPESTPTTAANADSAQLVAVSVAPSMPSQPSQGEISFPFSLDGYSNTSTSDSLKSLLNAFMANAPPGMELVTPTKEAPQPASFPMPSPGLLNFGAESQTTTDMPHHEDTSSSSFSTFINTLAAQQTTTPHPPDASMSDSLERKIYHDMLQTPGTSTLDPPTSDAPTLLLTSCADVKYEPVDSSQSVIHQQAQNHQLLSQQFRVNKEQNIHGFGVFTSHPPTDYPNPPTSSKQEDV